MISLRRALPCLLLAGISALQAHSALAQAPSAPVAALVAAEARILAGDSDGALAIVDPILKKDGKNARALLIRSSARCIDGDVDACKKDLDRALALDPTLRQGWLNRSALAIAEERYDDALAALAAAEKLDPAAPDNALNRGAVLLLAGRIEPATEQFSRYLAANPASADAQYLVATNFARAGYAALALQHLTQAIAFDERSRARARGDANFGDLAANPNFQNLLATDGYKLPPGGRLRRQVYPEAFTGADSLLVTATLNALQATGRPFDSRVEVADDWALFWSDVRIKLLRGADQQTVIELSSPAEAMTEPDFTERVEQLLARIDLELLKLAKNRRRP
ncbi:MAG: hypothetical protein U0X73_18160 [Thermoanaerobaculia bacterium]